MKKETVVQVPGAAAAISRPVELMGMSAVARRLRERVAELGRDGRHVLIVAPPGFDPVAVAAAIHAAAGCAGPFVALDCGAQEPTEIESRLFGPPAPRRVRGDLVESIGQPSALARARHGTLVLVGVTDLPISAQARLARVLRDGEVRVNGSQGAVPLGVRVIVTSEIPLEPEVRHGHLRADLHKRVAHHTVELPPLRERREDIAAIATGLMDRAAQAAGQRARPFTHAALALMAALGWDGNITEIEGVITEFVTAGTDAPVRVEDVLAEVDPGAVTTVSAPRASLREARRQFEREYIAAVLKHSGWQMGQAARVLGIQRTNLYRKARQLGIARAKGGE